MDGVHTLESFKKVLLSQTYRADAWAVVEVQKALHFRLVIVRDRIVQVEERPPGLPAGWSPRAFVVLRYDGQHYDWLYDDSYSAMCFTFQELPHSVQTQVHSAAKQHQSRNCWFAAYGNQDKRGRLRTSWPG